MMKKPCNLNHMFQNRSSGDFHRAFVELPALQNIVCQWNLYTITEINAFIILFLALVSTLIEMNLFFTYTNTNTSMAM